MLVGEMNLIEIYGEGECWLTDKSPETPIHSSLKPAIEIATTRTKSAYAD
jgi:hypothetical protein